MYDIYQQSALGVKKCKVNNKKRKLKKARKASCRFRQEACESIPAVFIF